MPQFDPSTFPTQIFWLILSFVALYFLLSRIAIPRIAEVLDERSSRIANDVEKAAALRQETEAVIADYEAAVAKARNQATSVIAQVNQEIADLAAKRQAEFGAELARKITAAETRITRAKTEAKAQVRDIAIEVAGEVAAKLTGTPADPAAVAKAVDAALPKEAA